MKKPRVYLFIFILRKKPRVYPKAAKLWKKIIILIIIKNHCSRIRIIQKFKTFFLVDYE